MKLNKNTLANTFGLATAVLWTACSTIVWLLPELSMVVFKWWLHGMEVSTMGDWNLTITNFLLGGVTAVTSAWVTGWILAWSWEILSKTRK